MMLRWWDPLPAGYSVKLDDSWPAEWFAEGPAALRGPGAKQTWGPYPSEEAARIACFDLAAVAVSEAAAAAFAAAAKNR